MAIRRIRARKPGTFPPPPPANEWAEVEAMLRRLEELHRAASNSDLRRAYETAIGSLDAVVYRLAMLRAPGPAATRAALTAAASPPPSAPKSSAAPKAAAARIGAPRKPRR
jgi:hypothetical protein